MTGEEYGNFKRLTTLKEFVMDLHLRPEEYAGFKAWLRGRKCATDEEWASLYAQYKGRTLK